MQKMLLLFKILLFCILLCIQYKYVYCLTKSNKKCTYKPIYNTDTDKVEKYSSIYKNQQFKIGENMNLYFCKKFEANNNINLTRLTRSSIKKKIKKIKKKFLRKKPTFEIKDDTILEIPKSNWILFMDQFVKTYIISTITFSTLVGFVFLLVYCYYKNYSVVRNYHDSFWKIDKTKILFQVKVKYLSSLIFIGQYI